MFALPGLLFIVFLDILRPQEYVAALRGVPLLYQAVLLSFLGMLVDLKLGLSKLRAGPHLLLSVLFLVWCLVTLGLREPSKVLISAILLAIPFTIYLVLAHGAQSFLALEWMAGVLLALALALGAVGVHQGFAPLACYAVTMEDGLKWTYDGRPCATEADCVGEGSEPGVEYGCERVGLFGTSSVKGRVRFRGSLEDPNELSLVIGIALPFAFAFFERKRNLARLLLVIVSVGVIGLCTYLTQSRGGQLVFLSVLGVYFIKRVGVAKGALVGFLFALPILLLGGRSGAEAEASSMERINCWWVGMHLFVSSPVVGVGAGMFVDHHYLTAHNSWILAAAELGLPGLVLWTGLLWVSAKIPILVLQRPDMPAVARTWSLALLASFAGMVVGVTFLSFVYKDVLWVYIALSGVLYGAVRRHDPTFRVGLGLRDAVGLVVACLGLAALFIVYTASKMGW